MSEPPYRDEVTGLRAELDRAHAARTAAEARVAVLEQESLLASGARPWRARLGLTLVDIDLIGGTAVVDGESFHF